MKFAFAIIIGLLIPLPLFAKERFVLQSTENVLTLSGQCSLDITLALTPVGKDDKKIYTSGTPCRNKEFTFSDDLAKWNIPEGQYTLWVNGEPAQKRIVMMKIAAQEPEKKAVLPEAPPKNRFEQATSDFGDNLKSMSVSLGIIEENLSSSDYADDTVKHALVGFLRSALDTMSGFFSDLTLEDTKIRPSEIESAIGSSTQSESQVPTPDNSSLASQDTTVTSSDGQNSTTGTAEPTKDETTPSSDSRGAADTVGQPATGTAPAATGEGNVVQ